MVRLLKEQIFYGLNLLSQSNTSNWYKFRRICVLQFIKAFYYVFLHVMIFDFVLFFYGVYIAISKTQFLYLFVSIVIALLILGMCDVEDAMVKRYNITDNEINRLKSDKHG